MRDGEEGRKGRGEEEKREKGERERVDNSLFARILI